MRDEPTVPPAPAAERAATAEPSPTPAAGPAAWLGLMALLLGGFALMGASFTNDNGWVFAAGLLLSGLAFVVPLATGHRER